MTESKISVSVPGKVILIGEHSVVYGHTAIAMPLSDVRLTLSIYPLEIKNSWNEVWTLTMLKKPLELTDNFRSLLTKSFEMAVLLFGKNLYDFQPQSLFINSDIPFGGGMGGSAAVAASFIRLCEKIFTKPLDIKTEIDFANRIDSLFHSGRASGLDVATILTEKLIRYDKQNSFQTIETNCSFYLALIDTNERTETCKMIEAVSNLIFKKDKKALHAMNRLNTLALNTLNDLKTCHLKSLAEQLNEAQKCLKNLAVSTKTIETTCKKLKSLGALCAKLTGAGGGGLVLSIFEQEPLFLKKFFVDHNIFITKL